MLRDEQRQATRCDNRGLVAQLLKDTAHQAVDAIGLTQNDVRPNGCLGAHANGRGWCHEVDSRQAGCVGEQSLSGSLHARRIGNGAASSIGQLGHNGRQGCKGHVSNREPLGLKQGNQLNPQLIGRVHAVVKLKALACDINRQSGITVGTTSLLVIPGNILSMHPSMTTVKKHRWGRTSWFRCNHKKPGKFPVFKGSLG